MTGHDRTSRDVPPSKKKQKGTKRKKPSPDRLEPGTCGRTRTGLTHKGETRFAASEILRTKCPGGKNGPGVPPRQVSWKLASFMETCTYKAPLGRSFCVGPNDCLRDVAVCLMGVDAFAQHLVMAIVTSRKKLVGKT